MVVREASIDIVISINVIESRLCTHGVAYTLVWADIVVRRPRRHEARARESAVVEFVD